MSIHSTIKSLYAIKCAAEDVCKDDNRSIGVLSSCLKMISDDEVNQSITELSWLLQELNNINEYINSMYILHYVTGTDKANKNVLLQTECVFGNRTVKFTTQFNEKAAQSLIEALNMSLAMVKAGDRLSEEGNA